MNKYPDPIRNPGTNPLDQHSQHEVPSPVLVVGMHNSGTSILTEILHANGIFFNPNIRHFECNFFTNFINDRIILGGGDNWAKLPLLSVDQVLSYQEVVQPLINRYWLADYVQWGYDGQSDWGIKDPRLCILLPLYLQIFPQAKIIHIRRDPNDIAASLTAKYKAGVGVLDDFDHWKSLADAYTGRILEFAGACTQYYELSYEEFCFNPQEQFQDLVTYLGLTCKPEAIALLAKVSPSRVGSYQRWVESRRHPWRSYIKSLLVKVRKI